LSVWNARQLFEPLGAELGSKQISRWWADRRAAYNLIVATFGVLDLFAYIYFWSASNLLTNTEDIVEPMLYPVLVFVFPIGWNACYCLGSIMQSMIPIQKANLRCKSGPLLLKLGLVFSMFLLSIPTMDASCAWLYQATQGFPKQRLNDVKRQLSAQFKQIFHL
jgi:hypothetical protein